MYQKSTYEGHMKKSVSAFQEDLSRIRAGRANPKILEPITFEYYGVQTPISHAATISVADARMITIQPWDSKNIKDIEKAILASDIGITPSNDGSLIRLPFPPLTEERRKDLVKEVAARLEEAKISVRNIRREGMSEIAKAEKNKEITEDEKFREEDDLQKVTDDIIKKLEDIAKSKEKELMEI